MNTFDIISQGFARHVLGNRISGDPFRDSAMSLTCNHTYKSGQGARLKKWGIFRRSGSTVASDLACKAVDANDPRTMIVAFVDELERLSEPVVFLEFGKALVDPRNVFATYDRRMVKLCVSGSAPVVFDLTQDVDLRSVTEIERKVRKEWSKRHAV